MALVIVAPIGLAIYQTWNAKLTGLIIWGMVILTGLAMLLFALVIAIVIAVGIYRRMKHSVQFEKERNWLISQAVKASMNVNSRRLTDGDSQPIFAPPINEENPTFDLITNAGELWDRP